MAELTCSYQQNRIGAMSTLAPHFVLI